MSSAADELSLALKVLDVALELPEGELKKTIVEPLRSIVAQIVARASVGVWFAEHTKYAPKDFSPADAIKEESA